jgi:hypothetical protein
MAQQEVFISYAWGGESELVADEIEAILNANALRLVRDKTDLGFKGLIREFMEQIGQGNLVVLVISDKYLKSKNCMFELLEVAKRGEFHSRVFPVVLTDADIYDSLGIITYLKYWDLKIKELNVRVKELDNLADTRKIQEDINLYTDIRGAIDDLAGKLSNMNTLTLETMRAKKYQPLLDALLEKSDPAPSPKPSKKEGKVLYHIPGMMQVERWTRCTVRLAWEELILTERLKIPEEERIIESIRLGNVMQVSLNEGKDGCNFEIKPLNNEEQAVFEDDFSEWLFDVKPLSAGNFTLILRVTLIQIVEGRERKKDIVLERNVVTEAVVPRALTRFETAESGLTPPESPKEESGLINVEELTPPNRDFSKVFPELSEVEEPPAIPPRISNRPSPMGSSQNPQPSPSYTRPTETAQPPAPSSRQRSIFKRFAPYAAGLIGILVVGYYGLVVQMRTGDNISLDSPVLTSPLAGEKMVVSLTLNANGPGGEKISDVRIFVIENEKLDSLALLDFGDYILTTYPTSDTMKRAMSEIGNFTILEIKDSIEALNKNPIRVGDRQIERKNPKINPD